MGTVDNNLKLKIKNLKLFILHGWAYSTEKWKPFIEELKEESLNPVLLKIPGLTEKIDKPWTLDNYVGWLKNKIGSQKVILLGHSNGGRIASAFTAKYSEKVSHLILIDSAGIYHKEFPIRLKRFLFGTAAKLGKKITKSERMRNILYKLSREKDYKETSETMRQTMINLSSVDLTSEFSKINIPTLIIWGEKDNITPLSDGELIHELIKNSRFHIIKDAKHSPQFTHKEQVVKEVLKFL